MKKRKNSKSVFTMSATTTSKDWGFGPVSGKGGKPTNSWISETMIHREIKEAGKL